MDDDPPTLVVGQLARLNELRLGPLYTYHKRATGGNDVVIILAIVEHCAWIGPGNIAPEIAAHFNPLHYGADQLQQLNVTRLNLENLVMLSREELRHRLH